MLGPSEVSKKSENEEVAFINHISKCETKLSVIFKKNFSFHRIHRQIDATNAISDLPLQKDGHQEKLIQFQDVIREEKQEVVLSIWEDATNFNVVFFIGLTAFEDDEEQIDLDGIDFNVIGFSNVSNRKVSAIESVDADCANSINRAYAYVYEKIKKIDCTGDDSLKEALDTFKKEKIVVDFVGN